ncbi:vWA domain-containing protein [Actomonas aquatica]|uniref:VWA domain-containing protein n=1 Tax=Actomonas aquatica TaxID=2866162 RepID=A0ABZ1C294_9BACT|nr:VWA domain-containing protein [Opitutus sp. WL0086]WRQ85675.1 VWA domain-containing protein [Opitutus sp. WL0086]
MLDRPFRFLCRLLATTVVASTVGLHGAELQLELSSERGFYPEATESEIFVAARILPPPAPANARPAPRNLALVLDVSGSMAGEPIQALRTATLATLDRLQDHETLAVVAFGSEVSTPLPATRVDQARTQTDALTQLEPAGGAALYDALNQGAAQLRRFATPTTRDELILLVDGPPTRGPREADDFLRLASALAREGIRLTTIGLGADFDEDLLAALARTGGGRFLYAPTPADLQSTLAQAVTTSTATAPVARDLTLTLTFKPYFNTLNPHGRIPAESTPTQLTYSLPDLAPGQPVALLASATIWNAYAAVGHQPAAVTAQLTWRDLNAPADAPARTTSADLDLRFSADARTVKESTHDETFRLAVDTLITDGLQDAIGHIDDGDFNRAQRTLRRTRTRVHDLAVTREDDAIAARLVALDTYLAEVAARGLNQLDRKILRSGLSNAFAPPAADDDNEDAPR